MKKILICLSVLLLCFCLFAEDSYRTYFPSLSEVPVYPVDKNIGQLVDVNTTNYHQLLSEALKQPFSFEWCEQYIIKNARKNLTTIYSSLLSSILPSQNFYFSNMTKNADSTASITVKFPSSKDILLFVVSDKYIIGINNLKK